MSLWLQESTGASEAPGAEAEAALAVAEARGLRLERANQALISQLESLRAEVRVPSSIDYPAFLSYSLAVVQLFRICGSGD